MSNRISSMFDQILGVFKAKIHPNKRERTSCRNARNATKPQFLLGFYHFAANTHIAKHRQTERKIDTKISVFWNLDQNLISGVCRRPKTFSKRSQD